MSEINCDCGYNYTQTGCPNCKHITIDYTKEYEQALANMQREYDRRGRRIEELEAKLAKAVEAAFYEGFCEGLDDGWVWGEPSSAWKNSYALAELKGQGV